MKNLTFVKLGYISPDEAIYNLYNFFFHHCINCLQPLVKLAEYDSFSVSTTFCGNKKTVTLGFEFSKSMHIELIPNW